MSYTTKEEQEMNALITSETINGVICKGFMVVYKTSVGLFIAGVDSPGVIQVVPTKESVTESFNLILDKLMTKDVDFRKEWDEVHPIICHHPDDDEVIKSWLSPVIKAQGVIIRTSEITNFGLPVSGEVLKFKALDLHDDLLASANIEREELAEADNA